MKVIVLRELVAEPEITIRCKDPEEPEIQELLRLIEQKKIPARQSGEVSLLDPSEVLYGEFVGRGVFLYTGDQVLAAAVSLAELEREHRFFRCSKSMAVNLRHIQRLKSEVSGRILATLSNGECILISRHYASSLRKALYNIQK